MVSTKDEPASIPLAADTPCRRCQYNLRGMPSDGRCPECGTPVALSMGSDLLRQCDAAWVATLRWGVEILFWATVGLVVVTAFGAFLAPPFRRSFAAVLVGIAYGLATLLGQWLSTTPDPGGRGEAEYGTSRKLVRVTVVLGLARQVNGFALRTLAMPPVIALPLEILGQTLSVVSLVGLVGMLHYFRRLSQRIPDDVLADRAGRLVYGMGIPLGLMEAYAIAVFVMAHFGGRRLSPWLAALGFVVLVLMVFGVVYLRLLHGLAKRLGDEAELSRRAWAAAEPANGSDRESPEQMS